MKATINPHSAAPRPSRSRIRNAFTLIELLVVIGIIAILVGMGAYVYPQAIDQAKKTRTKALLSDLVSAVKSYELEYNRLPADGTDNVLMLDGGEGAALLKVLIGENGPIGGRTDGNPREIKFIEFDISRGGSLGAEFQGDDPVKLLDAWGQVIRIAMDGDYDDKIPNPQGGDPTNIRKSVIAWSEGSPSQEKANEWTNNVKSWD